MTARRDRIPCAQACHPSEVVLRTPFTCCVFLSIELQVQGSARAAMADLGPDRLRPRPTQAQPPERLRRTAQNIGLFPPSRSQFSFFFSLSLGVFFLSFFSRWGSRPVSFFPLSGVFSCSFVSHLGSVDPQMCTFGLSGCRLRVPGGLTPVESKKRTKNWWRERGKKKTRIFGSPTLREPTFVWVWTPPFGGPTPNWAQIGRAHVGVERPGLSRSGLTRLQRRAQVGRGLTRSRPHESPPNLLDLSRGKQLSKHGGDCVASCSHHFPGCNVICLLGWLRPVPTQRRTSK